MHKNDTIKPFFKTFKGQIVIFLLAWSSCQTMTYYLGTENNRKAKRIARDYTEYEAEILGVDPYKFQFPDGKILRVKYNRGETRQNAVFFSVTIADGNLTVDQESIEQFRTGYLERSDLSFAPDSSMIGYTFPIIYSNKDPSLFMESKIFSKRIEDKDHTEPMIVFGIIWGVVLLILWVVGWVLYKVNTDDEILDSPEKDTRSFKVKKGTADQPNDWDDGL